MCLLFWLQPTPLWYCKKDKLISHRDFNSDRHVLSHFGDPQFSVYKVGQKTNMFCSILFYLFAVGPERGVVHKERASGLYRLSAYYFAKMTTELPMVFIYPVIFHVVIYFACNLTLTPENFFGSMLILWVTCLISQVIKIDVKLASDVFNPLTFSHWLL